MAQSHGKNAVVKLDDLSGSLQDVSAFFRSFDGLPGSVARDDTAGFGARGMQRALLGLNDNGPIRLGGLWHPAAGAKAHGKAAKFLFDQYAPYASLRTGSITMSQQIDDSEGFGAADKARDILGLLDFRLSCGGRLNPAAGLNHAVLAALRAQETPSVFTLGLAGLSIGSLVEMAQVLLTDFGLTSNHDQPNDLSGNFVGHDGFDLGVSLHDLVAETSAAPVNYSSVDESAATSEGGVGHLHVTAFTGTDITIKIQHSTDNNTWADLITFTQVTGVTKERIAVTGTVNRYVRAIVSAGTFSSATFVVAFGRRGFAYGTAGTHRHLAGLFNRSASSSFEYGPEGSANGALKYSGECRMQEMGINFNHDAAIDFTATLAVTGAITVGTFS